MIETYDEKIHRVEKENIKLIEELLNSKKFMSWLIEEMATVDRYFDRGETLKEILDYVLLEKKPWKDEDE